MQPEMIRSVQLGDRALSAPASQNFSEAWAKKYLQNLDNQDDIESTISQSETAAETADSLRQVLRTTSAQAWTQTEALLARELIRHQIDHQLIDPWAVAKDAHEVYEITLSAYAQQLEPFRLSRLIAPNLGEIRRKHTAIDPRVIGFISMQFHYSGQMLLNLAPIAARPLLSQYFKVIDDHLYMPLQRAYDAAAQHDYSAPALQTVQRLIPLCSPIANRVVDRVARVNPTYQSHSGRLGDVNVRVSSLRDTEMFQVYLWVCILENSVSAVQQELFPLCVMLYPHLKVRWEIVRQMLHLLNGEISTHLSPAQSAYFKPYYEALWAMFSPQVFPD